MKLVSSTCDNWQTFFNYSTRYIRRQRAIAYVLINCDLYHKSEVVKEISRLPGISESAELDAKRKGIRTIMFDL
jgi:hypothetical protein